ncbi:hypothetical protein ACFL5M_05190 [Candidatus Neomarinimicrobiota bacterium]
MKKHSRVLSLVIMLIVMACSNTDSGAENEQIFGAYAASTFTEPGELDGGVDILGNGGMLTAQLGTNYIVDGYLLIPENIGSNFASTNTDYYGEFNLDGDTVRFVNTETFLDHDPFIFVVKESRLETPDWSGHMAQTKIILEKIVN